MIIRHHKIIGIIGWYGVAAVIAAYSMINFFGVAVKSPLFLVVNLSGFIGIALDATYHKAYPAIAVNLILTAITIITILTIL